MEIFFATWILADRPDDLSKRRSMPTNSHFTTQTETPKFSITGQILILDISLSKSRTVTFVQKSRITSYL